MSPAGRQVPGRAAAPALLQRLARTQELASASTALYRNQFVHNDVGPHNGGNATGMHDFDFLFGRWRVHNERLRERLAGCNDWQRFDAIVDCRPILGGLGNIDEFVTDEFGPGVFIGASLRLFDAAANCWSIYWASNRSGVLEPAVVGRFANGAGRFEGDDRHAGVPVRVRFAWNTAGPDRATWEQAFSTDAGRTWETNWRMQFERLAARVAATDGHPPC